jgi:hypothetical protein
MSEWVDRLVRLTSEKSSGALYRTVSFRFTVTRQLALRILMYLVTPPAHGRTTSFQWIMPPLRPLSSLYFKNIREGCTQALPSDRSCCPLFTQEVALCSDVQVFENGVATSRELSAFAWNGWIKEAVMIDDLRVGTLRIEVSRRRNRRVPATPRNVQPCNLPIDPARQKKQRRTRALSLCASFASGNTLMFDRVSSSGTICHALCRRRALRALHTRDTVVPMQHHSAAFLLQRSCHRAQRPHQAPAERLPFPKAACTTTFVPSKKLAGRMPLVRSMFWVGGRGWFLCGGD